ncbi:MAG: phosphatidylinositol-specific phospholipase C domain-containing protein [Bacilli bacterium]|nr:phosphatidylinositol-specific phospholipase C domain-containing protein [Bacilli bacterium]
MTALPDETKIEDLSILGSHDTLALYGIGDFAGQCQSLPLDEQLKLGVRYLDLRLKESGNSLRACHGIVDEKQSFKETVSVLEKFLEAHPKEVLFASIKDEANSNSPTFEERLKDYVAEKNAWYVDSAMPATLGQARGKIVLLSRYSSSTLGVPSFNGWANSDTFQMGDFFIQDEYKVQSIAQKKQAITECYAASATYKINFLSGYLESGFPPSYAPSVAKEINPWFLSKLSTFDLRGITVADFVTTELANAFYKEAA